LQHEPHLDYKKNLQHLPEALRLKPPLFEVSKRDSDLDSLRANPAFQAILTDRALLAHVPVSDLISPQDLHEIIRGAASPLVIDVRGPTEYAVGHVAGAVNIPLGNLESQLSQIPQDRPVVTYCNMHNRGGSRGEQAAVLLRNQGYQVRTLDGGYPAWQEQGFRVETVVQV
jgi:rhodanese-related sulfurtransferase